jgi:hypothetical protein
MRNRIDQLFNKKLGEHRLHPSPEAWSKIESSLLKKNKVVILWRTAAVFALFGILTGALIWQLDKNDDTQLLVTQQKGTEVLPGTKETLNLQPDKKENKIEVVSKKSDPIKREKVTISTGKQHDVVNKMFTENQDVQESELVATSQNLIPEQRVKPEKPIVIEFTLAPVPSTTLIANATDVEKSNGFKKVLDKALDLKNGEGDLLGLRDVKNELFAFDFKKDKTKRN